MLLVLKRRQFVLTALRIEGVAEVGGDGINQVVATSPAIGHKLVAHFGSVCNWLAIPIAANY